MLFDYVLETCTAPGTGTTVSLAGAVAGRKSYAQVATTGSPVFYFLDDGTQSEWGFGTFTSGSPNTISRSTVLGNTANTTSRLNFSGATQIYNSLPATRAVWLDGNGARTTGMTTNGYDAGGLNFRAVSGSYGAGIRNDGNTVYLLSTSSGSAYGTYNTYRPFAWNLSTGSVLIDGTGVGTVFGGNVVLANNKAVYGNTSTAVVKPILSVDTGNNVTTWLADSTKAWRIRNTANTANLLVVNDSGVLQVTGNVNAASFTSNGNVMVGLTAGGYVCKQGSTGAFGANVFNFYWNSPYVYSYIDNAYIGAIQMVSDERLKHDIVPLTDGALSRILCLRPIHFRWQDRGIFRDDHKVHDGLIAQEVRRHIPDAVTAGAKGDDDTLTLQPLPLIAHLVKAIQELSAEVQVLKAIIYG